MAKIITAAEAAALFQDGATVAAASFGLSGWPEEVGLAVQERYRKEQQPKGITFMHAAGIGDWKSRGECAWAEDGLVKRLVVGHVGSSPRMAQFVADNKCECYFWPLGVVCQWYTEVARKNAGLFSKIGLGTFIDPRVEGGKVNDVTKEDIIKVMEIEGEEYLFYKAFPINIGLIRANTADENGNLSFEKESLSLESLPVAQAAKASGGIVIAQVETIAKAGSLNPQLVKVPGVCVDYIVVAEKPQWQTQGTVYSPALAGHIKVPENSIPTMEMDERKIIARRSAMELLPGAVNLGIGIPQGVASVLAEEGCSDKFTLVSESGNIGGIPGVALNFGSHFNGEAMLQQDHVFTWFDGGGLKMCCTGLGQVDKEGNINAGRFGNKPMGPGGFINTTAGSQKVVFAGTFTAGALEIKVDDGVLSIVKEGAICKFKDRVDQVAYSGKYAYKSGQKTVYVTERCVFELTADGMLLTEIAPGIDLEKDILAKMEFKPQISPNLKTMPAGIFKPVWGELKQYLDK
ncbi:MAG: carA 1 [Firmicutes bacterium]|nr:carA 1 [Bacillota bacterium]